MKTRPLLIVAALTLGLPKIVYAETRPTLLADHEPGAPPATLEFSLTWFTDSDGGNTLHSLAPIASFRYAFSESVELELDWPFGFADVSVDLPDGFPGSADDGSSSFRSGNPFAALYYVGELGQGYFRVGGGVALPLADGEFDEAADALSLVYPLITHGFWDPWLYLPDTLSIALPVQLETVNNGLVLGGDFAAGLLIATEDRSDNEDTDLVLQAAGLIGGKVKSATIGARLQVVWAVTSEGDNAFLALAPFVQADFNDGGFFFGRFLINLDEPFGVLGDGADVWGLHIGGGARF